MKSLVIIIILFTAACSHFNKSRTKDQNSIESLPKIKIEKQQVDQHPGHVRLIETPFYNHWEVDQVVCKDIEVPYYFDNGKLKFYLAESYFSKKEPFECRLIFNDGDDERDIPIAEVTVKEYEFPSERLRVAKRKVTLSAKDQKRVENEWLMLKKVYQTSQQTPYFTKRFKAPLNSYITSIYGTRRVFNNKKKSQHLGTDFRAAVGVPIPTTNRGKVVFAGELFYSGNTVILDHGVGIFSTYGHLSQILVQSGEILPRGTIIGKAGATGRVSGPHLHWGVKVHGHWVNGFSLVKSGI